MTHELRVTHETSSGGRCKTSKLKKRRFRFRTDQYYVSSGEKNENEYKQRGWKTLGKKGITLNRWEVLPKMLEANLRFKLICWMKLFKRGICSPTLRSQHREEEDLGLQTVLDCWHILHRIQIGQCAAHQSAQEAQEAREVPQQQEGPHNHLLDRGCNTVINRSRREGRIWETKQDSSPRRRMDR